MVFGHGVSQVGDLCFNYAHALAGQARPIRFDRQRNPLKPPLILEIKDGRLIYRGKIAP